MDWFTMTLIAVGLAMDALAVSLGVSTSGQIANLRGKIRLAAHFGIFQSGMTALGWLIGETVVQYVEAVDHWLAFVLLAYVAVRLFRSGLDDEAQAFDVDPSTGRILVLLSVATSIDAFAGIRLGAKFGKRMEIVGGFILLGIGVRVVVTHLF